MLQEVEGINSKINKVVVFFSFDIYYISPIRLDFYYFCLIILKDAPSERNDNIVKKNKISMLLKINVFVLM